MVDQVGGEFTVQFTVHVHYCPCNEYQAIFPPPLHTEKAAWGRG